MPRRFRLRAGVRLHFRVFGAVEPLHALDRKLLGDVEMPTAAVVALAGIALGVLVGERRAGRLQYRRRAVVLGRDQLQVLFLAPALGLDRAPELRIGLRKRITRIKHQQNPLRGYAALAAGNSPHTLDCSSRAQAYTASMCGTGVSVRRASSITAPTSASSSVARPASTSCSIDVLWLPTRAAPSMRRSSETRKAMPSLPATACASRIIAAARARVEDSLQMRSSFARVSALIGLKQRLPQSFSQISARMSASTGAFRPAASKSA